MYLMIGIFSINLTLTCLELIGLIGGSELNNFLKISFIMVHFNDVLRSFYRMVLMIKESANILIVFGSSLLFFTVLSRILFDGLEIGQDEDSIVFTYSFTSFFRTFESMFITALMENFPDVVIDAYNLNPLFAIYFGFIILFCSIVVFGTVVGVFGGNY